MGRLIELLNNPHPPVAIYHLAYRPEGFDFPESDDHCCIKSMLIPSAYGGKSICARRENLRCPGAHSGLALGEEDDRDILIDAYSDRSHYFDCRKRCIRNYIEQLPHRGMATDYVIFEPLERALEKGVRPEVVVFLTDPLHLSALTYLVGYDRDGTDSPAEIRYALSCEQICLLPILQGEKDEPKAIIGMTEFSTRRFLEKDILSFSVPFSLYERMDRNAEHSFLNYPPWERVKDIYKGENPC